MLCIEAARLRRKSSCCSHVLNMVLTVQILLVNASPVQ